MNTNTHTVYIALFFFPKSLVWGTPTGKVIPVPPMAIKVGYTRQKVEKRLEQVKTKHGADSWSLYGIEECNCLLEGTGIFIPKDESRGIAWELKRCIREKLIHDRWEPYRYVNEYFLTWPPESALYNMIRSIEPLSHSDSITRAAMGGP
jgi:hypothetical protein